MKRRTKRCVFNSVINWLNMSVKLIMKRKRINYPVYITICNYPVYITICNYHVHITICNYHVHITICNYPVYITICNYHVHITRIQWRMKGWYLCSCYLFMLFVLFMHHIPNQPHIWNIYGVPWQTTWGPHVYHIEIFLKVYTLNKYHISIFISYKKTWKYR